MDLQKSLYFLTRGCFGDGGKKAWVGKKMTGDEGWGVKTKNGWEMGDNTTTPNPPPPPSLTSLIKKMSSNVNLYNNYFEWYCVQQSVFVVGLMILKAWLQDVEQIRNHGCIPLCQKPWWTESRSVELKMFIDVASIRSTSKIYMRYT